MHVSGTNSSTPDTSGIIHLLSWFTKKISSQLAKLPKPLNVPTNGAYSSSYSYIRKNSREKWVVLGEGSLCCSTFYISKTCVSSTAKNSGTDKKGWYFLLLTSPHIHPLLPTDVMNSSQITQRTVMSSVTLRQISFVFLIIKTLKYMSWFSCGSSLVLVANLSLYQSWLHYSLVVWP